MAYEYDDVFELSHRLHVPLQTLPQMKALVTQAAVAAVERKKSHTSDHHRISAAVLYYTVEPSAASRKQSRAFVLKLILTILLTVLLISFLLVA